MAALRLMRKHAWSHKLCETEYLFCESKGIFEVWGLEMVKRYCARRSVYLPCSVFSYFFQERLSVEFFVIAIPYGSFMLQAPQTNG